jgi:ABC-type sugar transport system ATPase subunit
MEDAFELELNARVVGQLRGLSREVKVGFRPEDVSIRPEGGCEAQIYGVENMGMSKIVTLMLAEHRVKVTADAGFNVDIDAKVRFQINQEKLYFFSKETGENLLLTQSRKGE